MEHQRPFFFISAGLHQLKETEAASNFLKSEKNPQFKLVGDLCDLMFVYELALKHKLRW